MLVVHIGAGNHLPSRKHEHKQVVKSALRSTSHLDAASAVETCSVTNTGRGACLNLEGAVECDACIIGADMAAKRVLTMVAAHNIQHKTPTRALIGAEKALRVEYGTRYGPWGLSMPAVFDYGAVALRLGLETHPQSELVDSKKSDLFLLYKAEMELLRPLHTPNGAAGLPTLHESQDTVGVIFQSANHLSVLSSSGGNFFKFPGRIGCAGVPGAAAAVGFKNEWTVSCLCSGNGDDIVQMNLAANLVRRFEDPETFAALLVAYIEAAAEGLPLQARDCAGKPVIYVGVLCALISDVESILVYAHSTESFYFGYACGGAHTVLSRSKAGVFVQGEYRMGRDRRSE